MLFFSYTNKLTNKKMSDYMSDDVFSKIFSYLPPKSLVRFTSVCKSWQSLITSSNFITSHLNQTKYSNNINNNHLIFLRYYPGDPEKERHSLRIDNEAFDEYNVSEFPIKSSDSKYFRILGSCNGLICLSDDYLPIVNTVVLWNPSIRRSLTLPVPDYTFLVHGPFHHVLGFGYDSRTNDYKVVRIVYLGSEDPPRVQLYKLSTGYWETIRSTFDTLCFVEYMSATQAFINGAVHWPACGRDTGALIMSFNMSDEVFHEMRLPAGVVEDYFLNKMPVTVYGEWLSFFNFTRDHKTCSVWVMKEYGVVESWTKLYTFDLNGEIGKMLGFRRNGDLLVAMKNRELVSYEPDTEQIKNLGVFDSDKKSRPRDTNSYSFHADAYVESLVLLGMQTDLGRACDESNEEKEEDAYDESKEEQVCFAVLAVGGVCS